MFRPRTGGFGRSSAGGSDRLRKDCPETPEPCVPAVSRALVFSSGSWGRYCSGEAFQCELLPSTLSAGDAESDGKTHGEHHPGRRLRHGGWLHASHPELSDRLDGVRGRDNVDIAKGCAFSSDHIEAVLAACASREGVACSIIRDNLVPSSVTTVKSTSCRNSTLASNRLKTLSPTSCVRTDVIPNPSTGSITA